MNQATRIRLLERLRRDNPAPKTELRYGSNFELLIAVILSAQATDVSVNKVTGGLFRSADTPGKMLALGLAGLRQSIRSIGLYNSKARHIIKTCQILVDEHDGQVPQHRAALERLPGVGRKTANVILNTAFGQPVIAVDTHIFRVANRTGLAPGKDVRAVERRLLEVIPDAYKLNIHHWLILHGRYVCVARRPKCGACILYQECGWPDKASNR